MKRSEFFEHLAAYATPTGLPTKLPNRDARHWIVRTKSAAAYPTLIAQHGAEIARRTKAAVASARAEMGLPPNEEHAPDVELISMGGHHLVVRITTVELAMDTEHGYLVAAVAALGALEESVPIDDIQGIPRRYWRLLLGETDALDSEI